MILDSSDLDRKISRAVRHFWLTRSAQAEKQGKATGKRDAGSRAAVTGGAQMDGFVRVVTDLLHANGIPQTYVRTSKGMELPGWFRAEKKWDLLVIADGKLLAGIEFKSQIGPSFGNNFNNRAEEAIGSAADLWAAFREGAFKPSERPWLGYLMMLEDAPASTRAVRASEPNFGVFPEFKDSSYLHRYQVFLTKLVRERLYDATCFLISDAREGLRGVYREPSRELRFENFAVSLLGRALAITKSK